MDLMSWIIAWAIVTTAVVVLGYLRLTFGLHEVSGVRFGSGHQEEFYQQQQKMDRKLHRLDFFGIALTVISALMVLVIIVLWAIESAGA